MASFEEIRAAAYNHPTIVPLPRLSSFYLQDFNIYNSIEGFHRDLYDPEHRFERDAIIDVDDRHPEYPRMECDEETVSPRLNGVVKWADGGHHERLRRELRPQSKIQDYILSRVRDEEVIVYIMIDGLSYEAVRQTALDPEPVVVDGITSTDPGFRRLVFGTDKVSVYSRLLTKKNYTEKFGFTYWERDQEDLSTDLHAAMGNSIHRIRDFEECRKILRNEHVSGKRTYIQITRMGMDQDSHNRKEEPLYDAVLGNLLDDLRELRTTLRNIAEDYRLFLTADHGILWREDLPENPPVVGDNEPYEPARVIKMPKEIEEGMQVTQDGGLPVVGLAYPYLARELKHTEWGVHGGFSYYESIVPLIEITEETERI